MSLIKGSSLKLKPVSFQFTDNGKKIEGEGIAGSFNKIENLITPKIKSNLDIIQRFLNSYLNSNFKWVEVHGVVFEQDPNYRGKGGGAVWNIVYTGKDDLGNVIHYHKYEGLTAGGGQSTLYANGSSRALKVLSIKTDPESVKLWIENVLNTASSKSSDKEGIITQINLLIKQNPQKSVFSVLKSTGKLNTTTLVLSDKPALSGNNTLLQKMFDKYRLNSETNMAIDGITRYGRERPDWRFPNVIYQRQSIPKNTNFGVAELQQILQYWKS